MSFFKKFAVNLALVLLGCLLAAVLLEGVLRVYNPFHFRVRAGKIELLTNIKFKTENNDIKKLDRVVVHSKNSLGFRGAPPPLDLDRWLTLITIGGSTTECFYVSDGKAWPDILAKNLSGQFARVWVNNAGLDGHSTFGHIQLLKEYIIALHPKCALFLVGINDVARDDLNMYDRHEQGLDIIKPREQWLQRLADRSEFLQVITNLCRYLDGYRRGLTHREIDLAAMPLAPDDPETARQLRLQQQRYLEPYARRLREIIRLCRENGIEPVLLTQPALYGHGLDPTTGVDLGAILVGDKVNGRLAWETLELYNDVTRRLGGQLQVPVVDLARKLPKDSRYFYDYFHFTNAGSEQVGEMVARELTPWLAAKFPDFRRADAGR